MFRPLSEVKSAQKELGWNPRIAFPNVPFE